ncbi:DUF4350 domain-containing protein [Spirulina sp. CCNP1310]|uniref:DUF4350 domain-containing protein n=1 Tax=Spirulina sp. CCNP1310 TaxID=3110249 RepID=UPI002B1F658A|nr:DUF4350 domain-containing protein [Spirulina sp. CCNP1310]MEA5420637.1 DUF4350 domain-containing protein [Spirulina sp. CCNP1310]
MNRFKRWQIVGAVALGLFLLVGLLLAPAQVPDHIGSTYTRGPSGYGAWYSWMETQGATISRWRRPATELEQPEGSVLIQIYSHPRSLSEDWELDTWVREGNTLIAVGVNQPVTGAKFRSAIMTPWGLGRVETRRRRLGEENKLWGDRFGAVVWREQRGEGEIIAVSTPFLAANAYQDHPANFQLLAHLALQPGEELGETLDFTARPVWVDEYLHGYRDPDPADTEETPDNIWAYFARTPLLPMAIQGGILGLVAIAALNRRFGPVQIPPVPPENNSQAYIEALAAVLSKAEQHRFALDILTPEATRQLQESLGFGPTPMTPEELRAAWIAQGKSPQALQALLKPNPRPSEAELIATLQAWQNVLDSPEPKP